MNTLVKLPESLDKVVEKDSPYDTLKSKIEGNTLLSNLADPQAQYDAVVQEHAARPVECVLLGDYSWAFITHFDVFVRDGRGIDDCAQQKLSRYYEEPEGFLLNRGGDTKGSYAQLVVRWGYLEFLVIAGYCGEIASTSRKAFCGSALPEPIVQILQLDKQFSVNVPVKPVRNAQGIRFLRDYTRLSACNLWSFESHRFVSNGVFRACHPLSISSFETNAVNKSVASVASHILAIAASKVYRTEKRNIIMSLVLKTKVVRCLLEKPENSTLTLQNFRQIFDLVKANHPTDSLLKPLQLLVDLDNCLLGNVSSVNVTSVVQKQSFKSATLELYQDFVGPAIKSNNKRTIAALSPSSSTILASKRKRSS